MYFIKEKYMIANKKHSLILRSIKTLFVAIFIICLFAYIKPLITANYLPNDTFKSIEYKSLGLLDKKQLLKFNSKNPRELFMSYYYKSLALWLGYHNYYFYLLNNISPEIIKVNDYTENAQNLKIEEMLVALIQTDFTWDDVPIVFNSNKMTITLGHDNKHTFYIARKSNGNWYFTKQNFDNPQTHEKFIEFMQANDSGADNATTIRHRAEKQKAAKIKVACRLTTRNLCGCG